MGFEINIGGPKDPNLLNASPLLDLCFPDDQHPAAQHTTLAVESQHHHHHNHHHVYLLISRQNAASIIIIQSNSKYTRSLFYWSFILL